MSQQINIQMQKKILIFDFDMTLSRYDMYSLYYSRRITIDQKNKVIHITPTALSSEDRID